MSDYLTRDKTRLWTWGRYRMAEVTGRSRPGQSRFSSWGGAYEYNYTPRAEYCVAGRAIQYTDYDQELKEWKEEWTDDLVIALPIDLHELRFKYQPRWLIQLLTSLPRDPNDRSDT